MSKDNAKRNPMQMFRADGNHKIMELMSPSQDFQKITMNIIQYDNNNKKTSEVSYFFDIPWFLEFCRKITSNALFQKLEYVKTLPEAGRQPIIKMQGGNEKKGIVTAREFTIDAARVGDVLFKIVNGPGKKTKEGLTPLDYSRSKEFRTGMISMPYQKMYEMAAICKIRIEAFIIYLQLSGFYNRENYPQNNNNAGNINVSNNMTENPQSIPQGTTVLQDATYQTYPQEVIPPAPQDEELFNYYTSTVQTNGQTAGYSEVISGEDLINGIPDNIGFPES